MELNSICWEYFFASISISAYIYLKMVQKENHISFKIDAAVEEWEATTINKKNPCSSI